MKAAIALSGRAALLGVWGACLMPGPLQGYPYPGFVEVTGVANDRVYESADVAWGDADNDGDLDIVACGRSNNFNRQLFMYPGNGAGGFGAAVDIPPAGNAGVGLCAAALGDLDGDGDLDVAVAGRRTGNATNNWQDIRVHIRGAAAWTLTTLANGTGVESGGLALGDYDNDGDLDLLVTGIHRNDNVVSLWIYRNEGNGTTYTRITPAGTAGIWNGGADWADFDGDGRLDMAVSGALDAAGANRRVRVYRNNGDGTWNLIDLAPGLNIGDVAWGDLNGDGRPDVAAMGTNDGVNEQIRWWANNGAGGFGASQLVAANNAGLSQGGLALADVDRDGDVDVVANGSQNGTVPQIVVYTNNGAGVFTANAVANGTLDGAVALGDANANGNLDLAAVGTIDGTQNGRRTRTYASGAAANAAPNAPAAFTSTFTFSATGVSTASFSWTGAADNPPGATPPGLLSYSLEVSTVPGPAAPLVVADSSFANAANPSLLTSTDPWNAPAGARYGLQTDTTYYYRVQTVDAGLLKSAWSPPQTLWTGVAPGTSTVAAAPGGVAGAVVLSWASAGDDGNRGVVNGIYRVQYSSDAAVVWNRDATPPGAFTVDIATSAQAAGTLQSASVGGLIVGVPYYFVIWTRDDAGLWSGVSNTASAVPPAGPPPLAVGDLTVVPATLDGQIVLTWTSPLNGGPGSAYDVRWSLAAIGTDAAFNVATPLSGEPAASAPGSFEVMNVRNVPPDATVFFALKTTNAGGTSPLSNSPSGVPLAFDRTEINVGGGPNTGLSDGDVAWGDLDGDGLWDLVALGLDAGGARRLRVYRNAGGTFAAPLELAGLSNGNVALGDLEGDGDLDILASGNDGANRQLVVHVNNSSPGSLSFPSTAHVPGSPNQGFDFICGLEWSDMNNDGTLDVVACGDEALTGQAQLYVFGNNGDGTFAAAVDVTAGTDFYRWGDLTIADFNNDGRQDIAAMGYNTAQSVRQLAVYTNTGSGYSESIVPGGLSSGALDAGDYDSDGWVDLLLQGFDGNRQLRALRNNAGAFNLAPVNIPGVANQGLNRGEVAWADYDNDGDLDALAHGSNDAVNAQVRLYPGNGAGGFGAAINIENVNGGLINEGAAAWGDFDQDGDADLAVSGDDGAGQPQVRVYVNYYSLIRTNNPPGAPPALATSFDFSSVAVSTAEFKWDPAADDLTPPPALRYQVQVATSPGFAQPLAINTPSPQYFPQIYDGGARHGTVLTSTEPWVPIAGGSGLMTDTTYYFRVRTIDGGELESPWSGVATLWTGVAPGTSTLSASATVPNRATLSWLSAGDDANRGELSGDYRIQYSTVAATVWDRDGAPPFSWTVTVPTGPVQGGDPQTYEFSGLLDDATYYFVLWTRDEAGQWSGISNTTQTWVPVAMRSLTVLGAPYAFGNTNVGVSTQTFTPMAVSVGGNVNSTLSLHASTITAGSPWVLGPVPGSDAPVLYGGVHPSQPGLVGFGPEDVITGVSAPCDAAVFSINGSELCRDLPPGSNRSLWFRLDMPTLSSVETQQEFLVTVEAGPP